MKKIALFVTALIFSVSAFAQFEGSIEFKMENKKDTNTNVYYVKGDHVRLDQLGKKTGKVEGSFVFDLSNKQIKFLNPARKVWGEHKSETPAVIKGKCEVTKTKNVKTYLGKKCTEYVVLNTDENTQISYWITTEKFDFFVPMVKMWNRKDKQSIYFNEIKDLPKGSMPLASYETTLDGKTISKLEMTKIEKKGLELTQVSVPADYKKFEQ
ncbi:MAG: hypothetical protein K0S33_2089 [Bacteroidetes bacterium]|jgi:hypothetical protein|nr:hypothetical protein [Bacteroidota bacterium]